MKNILLPALCILIASVHANIFAQNYPVNHNDKEFETESFHSIHVSSAFEVYLTQADEYSVTAEADKDVADDIKIEVRNGVLEVGMKEGYNKGGWWNSKKDHVVVHITFPTIEALKVSGSVELDAKNVLDLDDFELKVHGASDVHLHLKCDNIEIDLSGASKLSMDVHCDDFELEANGASSMELTGKANEVEMECSGASNVDADGLAAGDLEIECSGASHISAWATDDVEIEASGASSIKYKCDNCNVNHVASSGASSVKKY